MKTNRKTLKGTVLFTVVSVLSLLIIFLTSALVLASAANNRAHKSYSSSQVKYTARSAIDSVLAAVSYNTDFAKAVAGISESSAPVTVSVDMNNQGMGKIDSATLSYAGTKQMYNPETFAWETKKLIAVTADVTLAGETTKVTSYVVADPIQITRNGGGAGFLSQGSASVKNHTCALGGTYFGVGLNDGNKDYTNLYGRTTPTDPISPGFWSGDTFDGVGADDVMEAPFVIDGSFAANTQFDIYFQRPSIGFDIWGDFNISQLNAVELKTTNLSASDITSFAEIPHLYVDGDLNLTRGSNLKLVNSTTGEILPFNIFCGTFQAIDNQAQSNEICADIYCMNPGEDSNITNKTTHLKSWTSSVADGTLGYDSIGGNFFSRGNLTVGDQGSGNDKYFAKDVRVEGNVTINSNTTIKGDLVVGGTLTVANGVTVDVGGTVYTDNVVLNGGQLKTEVVNGNYTYVDTDSLKDGYTSETVDACIIKNTGFNFNGWISTGDVWVTPDYIASHGYSSPTIGYGNNTTTTPVYASIGEQVTDLIAVATGGVWENPRTCSVYKDAAGNVVTAAEAINPAGWYDETGSYLTDQASATTIYYNTKSALADYSGAIYPQYAYKEVLLDVHNTYGIDNHVVKTIDEQVNEFDFTSTPTTIDNVSQGLYNDISQISAYAKQSTITDDVRFESGTTYNASSGNLPNGDIRIEPDGHDVIIVLDGCTINEEGQTNGAVNFIIDDTMSGEVKFYINGNVNLGKMSIITKSFKAARDNNTTVHIYSTAEIGNNDINAPNVYVYSSYGAAVSSGNYFYATAYFEAPYLDFSFNASNASVLPVSNIYYDDMHLSELPGFGYANIIGCFDINTYNKGGATNDFGILYMDPSGTTPPSPDYQDALGEHVYEAVEYINN